MSFNLDFLRLLGPETEWFPRKVMTNATGGQVLCYDGEDLVELVKASAYLDCFIQTHTVRDQHEGVLRVAFIDIDFKGDLPRAKKVTDRVVKSLGREYGLKPYVQFSGFKGYHILIPIKQVKVSDGLASQFLRYLQTTLSKGYCDPQLLGDIVRLWRLPFTYNSKAIIAGLDGDGLVKPIQEWDGRLLDPEELWYQFGLVESGERLKAKRKRMRHHPVSGRRVSGVRSQVQALIEKARTHELSHKEHHAILCELIAAGKTDDEICQTFKEIITAEGKTYNDRLTRGQISHARRRQYKPYRLATLKTLEATP
jgi:hypothetical protein